MESSEMQKKVISLGNALVEELGLEPGVDTLSRWLAHYVAEQLACLENAMGDEKIQVQRRCFETILTLWQHRSSFRNSHRPFENFEAIFKTLDALNPENPHSYYRYWNQDNETDRAATDEDAKHWLDMAINIDHAARDWINFALNQAVERALDEKTRGWLDKAISVMPDDDLAVVIRLVSKSSEINEEDDTGKIKIDRIKNLEAKLEKLDAFFALSELIRKEIITEIQQLNTELRPNTEDKSM
jgi:serine/threonine protein kinase